MENIINQIISIILKTKPRLDLDKIKPESKFIDDLDFDSLEVVDLVMDLETEFYVTIDDQDATQITTVQDLATKIKDLVDKKKPIA